MILKGSDSYTEVINTYFDEPETKIGIQEPQLFDALNGPENPTYTAMLEKREKVLDDQDTSSSNRIQRFQLLGTMQTHDIIDFLSLAEKHEGNGTQESQYHDMLKKIEEQRGIENISSTQIYYTISNPSSQASSIIKKLHQKIKEETKRYNYHILEFTVNNLDEILGHSSYKKYRTDTKRAKKTISLTREKAGKALHHLSEGNIFGTLLTGGYDFHHREPLAMYIKVYDAILGKEKTTDQNLENLLKKNFPTISGLDSETTETRTSESTAVTAERSTENPSYTNIINKRKPILNKDIETKNLPFDNNWKEKFQILSSIKREDVIELLSLPENNSGSGAQEAEYSDLLIELGKLSNTEGISYDTKSYSDNRTSKGEERTINRIQKFIEKELLIYHDEILNRIKDNADSLVGKVRGYSKELILEAINEKWLRSAGTASVNKVKKDGEESDQSSFHKKIQYSERTTRNDNIRQIGLFIFLQARNYLLGEENLTNGIPGEISGRMGEYSERKLSTAIKQVFTVQ